MLCKNVNEKLFSNCHVKPWNYKTLIIVEPRSIFYSRKIVYLQINWFTECNRILIEH